MKVIVNTGRKVVLAVTLGMKIGPPGGRYVTKLSHGPGSILEMSGNDAQFHIARGDVRAYEETTPPKIPDMDSAPSMPHQAPAHRVHTAGPDGIEVLDPNEARAR